MIECMPRFCTNQPFLTTGLSSKALVFILLIAHHIIVDGKSSAAKTKISPDVPTSVTLSLALETELCRLNNTL